MNWTRKHVLLVLFTLISLTTNAQPIRICFTTSPALANITLAFTSSPVLADLCVWAGRGGFTDVDVCFVSSPNATSIDIDIVDNATLADGAICITNYTTLADKTLCVTSSPVLADICLGIWDSPTAFTKDIYIKGIDPKRLSMETKVAIVYSLGLLKKK